MSRPATKQSTRIETLDLLRGYFLISITITHLNYLSPLSWLTARSQLFMSSAEGFFFISGIVLGMVRGAKLVNESMKRPTVLILKRTLQLYSIYILSTVLFTLIGWWFYMDNPGLKPGIAPQDTSFWVMLWQSFTFQYLYGWHDYLRLYIAFMAVTPLVILLLRMKKWWIVMAASFMLWLLAPAPDYPQSIYTQPLHWQIIFFGGISIGFHWKDLTVTWARLSRRVRVGVTTSLLTVAFVTFALNCFLAFGGLLGENIANITDPLRGQLGPYFDKENLRVARLLMFLVWFWASYWLFHRFEARIKKAFGWLLLSFGTNSLYVYIVSGVILFFTHLYIPRAGYWVNSLTLCAVIGLTLLCVRTKFLMKIIPR